APTRAARRGPRSQGRGGRRAARRGRERGAEALADALRDRVALEHVDAVEDVTGRRGHAQGRGHHVEGARARSARAVLALSAYGDDYLPAYSPALNPIEPAWAKVKAELRRVAARTVD